jgi:hypothetical protein
MDCSLRVRALVFSTKENSLLPMISPFNIHAKAKKLWGRRINAAPAPETAASSGGASAGTVSSDRAEPSVVDGPAAWGWAAATGVLWGLSYFFWRRLQATPASADPLP